MISRQHLSQWDQSLTNSVNTSSEALSTKTPTPQSPSCRLMNKSYSMSPQLINQKAQSFFTVKIQTKKLRMPRHLQLTTKEPKPKKEMYQPLSISLNLFKATPTLQTDSATATGTNSSMISGSLPSRRKTLKRIKILEIFFF